MKSQILWEVRARSMVQLRKINQHGDQEDRELVGKIVENHDQDEVSREEREGTGNSRSK